MKGNSDWLLALFLFFVIALAAFAIYFDYPHNINRQDNALKFCRDSGFDNYIDYGFYPFSDEVHGVKCSYAVKEIPIKYMED